MMGLRLLGFVMLLCAPMAEAGDEIWVAAGTYRPAEGADRDAEFDRA